MSAIELLRELADMGFQVFIIGTNVKLKGSKSKLTPSLRDRVSAAKPQMLQAHSDTSLERPSTATGNNPSLRPPLPSAPQSPPPPVTKAPTPRSPKPQRVKVPPDAPAPVLTQVGSEINLGRIPSSLRAVVTAGWRPSPAKGLVTMQRKRVTYTACVGDAVHRWLQKKGATDIAPGVEPPKGVATHLCSAGCGRTYQAKADRHFVYYFCLDCTEKARQAAALAQGLNR